MFKKKFKFGGDSIGNDLYSGAADIGKAMAYLAVIPITILCVILIFSGISTMNKKNTIDPLTNKLTDNKTDGLNLIIGSFVVIGFCLLNIFLVKKYKGLAALEGIGDISNMFRR
jgi:hypothetical protein